MIFELRGVLRAGVAGIALVAAASVAQAAGFQLREQSSEGIGNSFAGSAAKAYNASTIWYNPAGMTLLNGNQFASSTTYIMPQARFSGSSNFFGSQNTGDAIDDAAIGALYGFWDFSKDLKFGVSVTTPFGLRTKYPTNWVGKVFGIESAITNVQVTPSVAYRINSNLSIGAGIDLSYLNATLSSFSGAAGIGTVTGDSFGAGYNVGALYEFSPTSRIGLTYRSAIYHGLKGDISFSAAPPPFSSSATAAVTLPQQIVLSAYHEIDPKWAVMADLQWTGWSSMKDITINGPSPLLPSATQEHWRDTFFASLGVNYKMVPNHTLHFGTAYDQGVVKSADLRTPRLPDSDRFWLSTGYTWDISKAIQWNIGYAHIFVKTADTNLLSSTGVTLVGNFKGSVDMISTSFAYKF